MKKVKLPLALEWSYQFDNGYSEVSIIDADGVCLVLRDQYSAPECNEARERLSAVAALANLAGEAMALLRKLSASFPSYSDVRQDIDTILTTAAALGVGEVE